MIRPGAVLLGGLLLAAAVSGAPLREISTSGGGRIRTLDPAFADDLASRNLICAVYDTLLEYDYDARPYKLKPSMLRRMPEPENGFRSYRFELRDDLYFAADPVFGGKKRRITSRDVLFSFLRLADSRNHSPLYWLFRGRVVGIDAFHARTAACARGDMRPYDEGVTGYRILSDTKFVIDLTGPDPRFLYALAMPNAAVVPREAVEFYGESFARHPVGSGPFLLKRWINDCRIELVRNPAFRKEFYPGAASAADRTRPLPLADRIVIKLVKQSMTAWMLFLQGNLDCQTLDKDNSDLAGGGELPEVLRKRGIRLQRVPEFEIRYIGFNFGDPRFEKNEKLRQALSLAFSAARRIEHSGNQLLPAAGPIPPGVAGFDEKLRNPWMRHDVAKAKKLLAEAGFPEGKDPATGKRLKLTFDQTGHTSSHRQFGEITAAEFAELGIELEVVLNNNPRFYEKLRGGKMELFRLSWIGDYPDAENFLQLFYSGNAGGCNRTGFSDPVFDRMFEETLPMPDSPERTAKYRKMAEYIARKCVWIYEGFPVSYQLNHAWLENYTPHDFGFARWKYLSVDTALRDKLKRSFTPLKLSELAGKP
jgi:ABC-type transport system substrate-binding protein